MTIRSIFRYFSSCFIALLRLLVLNGTFIFTGIHSIFFRRTEISAVRLEGIPLKCDREEASDKISFLDKLCYENSEYLSYLDENEEEKGDE